LIKHEVYLLNFKATGFGNFFKLSKLIAFIVNFLYPLMRKLWIPLLMHKMGLKRPGCL